MSDIRNEPNPQRPRPAAASQGQTQHQGQNQNQGEGNKEAAAEFNKAEKQFVDSARGQQKIRNGTHVGAGEEAELGEAEERAKSHAKAQDSNRM
jgi:hypothetical protein